MKQLFLFILLTAGVFCARSQKNPADKPLKKVYGKEEEATQVQTVSP
jgi:hypothetical protein